MVLFWEKYLRATLKGKISRLTWTENAFCEKFMPKM